jgi:hypothetical protein
MRNFNGIPLASAINGNLAQSACLANSTVDDTVNVPGARVGDHVVVTPNSNYDAGLMLGTGWVSSAGVVTVRFMNTTAGALPAGAAGVDYRVIVLPRD